MAIDYTGGGAIDERVITKRAIFQQEIRQLFETGQLLSPIATKLVSKAKYLQSPFADSGDAKTFTQDCVVPVSPITIGNEELVIDRWIGDSHVECDVDFSYAKFDLLGEVRRNLRATMYKKLNEMAIADFVATATDGTATPVDLSTSAAVTKYLVGLNAFYSFEGVGYRSRVEGASIMRAEYESKPFLLAGADAFVSIQCAIQNYMQASTARGLDGKFIDTPWGVRVFNLGSTPGVGPNFLMHGLGGIPVMAYRDDEIKVGQGRLTDTIVAANADLEIAAGDTLLEEKSYMMAKIKTKNHIFSRMAHLVTHQVMA